MPNAKAVRAIVDREIKRLRVAESKGQLLIGGLTFEVMNPEWMKKYREIRNGGIKNLDCRIS